MSERLTISVDREFASELRAIARREGKPLSRLIRDALEEWLMNLRKKKGKRLLSLVKEKPRVDEEEALKAIKNMRKREW